MKRYRFFKLIFHITYSCNMSCKGCLAVSDIPREGVQPYEEVLETIKQWSQVLDPHWIQIFGGETLMHPRIKDIVKDLRTHWPDARISLPTNGLLLRRIMDPEWIESVVPMEVRVSLHRNDDEGRFFKPLIKDFMSMYTGWQRNTREINEYGLPESNKIPMLFNFTKGALSIAVVHYENFVVPYTHDEQGRMAPYDNDPDEAWQGCVSPELVYLYKQQLWKCIPYPNLKDTAEDFDRWPNYTPYSFGDDLTPYFANMNRAESLCSMCPTRGEQHSIQHSPDTVKILPKAKWIQGQVKGK